MHISLAAEPLFHLGSLTITNSMITSLVGSLLILILFALAGRSVALAPRGKWSQIIEAISEYILSLIEQVTHDRKRAESYFALLMTFFVFILINNWLGLLPGVGSIVVHSPEGTFPLFRAATADLNTTLALAIISVVMTQAYAIRRLGLFRHAKKYISLSPVMLFVGFLEIISEFSKMVSFSFRLFGNIFAGEVLLIVISALIPLIGPLPFFGLELFVGLVQAFVFTLLSLVFLEIVTSDHAEEHHHSPDHSLAQHNKLVETASP